MKKLIYILFIIPLSLLNSCTPDRDLYPTGPNYNTYGLVDATVNGYTWGASSGDASYSNFTLYLYGEAPDGTSLSIAIYPYNGIGSYAANPAQISFYDYNGFEYAATTGTVTITSDYGDQVQGNFSFSGLSGSQSIDMSGGFSLYYQ